jgi:hypothetical protein
MRGDIMPFKSKAQQRYMFVHHPKIAKKWAKKYGVAKNLPEKKVQKKKRTKKWNPYKAKYQ